MNCSVILTTHHGRKDKCQRAIESVLNQSYQDFELVIVDDGSHDGTQEMGEAYAKNHKNVVYVRNENCFGCDTQPKNLGILSSKGKYLAFLDSDNVYRQDHLQALVGELEKSGVDGVYGDRWIVDDSGKNKPMIGKFYEFNPTYLMVENYIDTSDVLIKREAIEYVGGFDERYKKYIDWNLWLRLAKAGFTFKRTPVVITDYHIHDDQKSLRLEDTKGMNRPAWDPVDLEIRLGYLGKKTPPRVAIYTITYDRLEYTKKSFETLKATAHYPYDHFVVDNGSSDGTVEWLMSNNDIKHVSSMGVNKGISIASNHIVKLIKNSGEYDIIVKVDNDAFFKTDGWLKSMVRVWETNHMLLLSPYVEGLIDNPGGAPRLAYGMIADELMGMTRHIGGIACFADASTYDDFKWDENDTLHGVQDLEFSQYCLRKGYQMGYLENYFVSHGPGTQAQQQDFPEYFERRKSEKTTAYEADQ